MKINDSKKISIFSNSLQFQGFLRWLITITCHILSSRIQFMPKTSSVSSEFYSQTIISSVYSNWSLILMELDESSTIAVFETLSRNCLSSFLVYWWLGNQKTTWTAITITVNEPLENQNSLIWDEELYQFVVLILMKSIGIICISSRHKYREIKRWKSRLSIFTSSIGWWKHSSYWICLVSEKIQRKGDWLKKQQIVVYNITI